jgi:hypothetical protein
LPALRVLSEDGSRIVREIPVATAEATIGRSSDNTVVLTHDSVSRHHARLQVRSRGYVIVDEDSANGVWVRNQRVVGSSALASGELFRVGDVLLQIVDDAAPAAAAATPAAAPAPTASAPRAKSRGCWAAVLLFLVASSCCGGGLVLYALRDHWMPLVSDGGSSASTDETPGPTAAPTAEPTPTPCPPPDAHLCPWTYKAPTTTASECPPGFCWDGGPTGSESCKQQHLAESSHRNQWREVYCDEGFIPVFSHCSNAIERCVRP